MISLQVIIDANSIEQVFMLGFLSFIVSMILTPIYTRNIPTMAGIIFILSTLIVTVAGNLSRSETWLPLVAMVGAGTIGLLDDIINIRGFGGNIAGMRTKVKTLLLLGVALIGGWWFFAKLGVTTVHVPFFETWHLGWLIIPLFILVVFSTGVAVNMSDGLDGLAGGLSAIAFGWRVA
jgi:phospho-N-acetylmuramoyl-pentapeptide-transferase